jgi:hypothetical protein|tara:strand:- start:497 stop:619 length:123 start_codon:yes stop_codon:yes gene_type:complete
MQKEAQDSQKNPYYNEVIYNKNGMVCKKQQEIPIRMNKLR